MPPPHSSSSTDTAAAAADGFVFGYPLVLMSRMHEWMTCVQQPDPQRMLAPPNRFVHARALPEAITGRPAGPRAGALRSSAWLDLGAGPVLLSVPGTQGRFYALSLVDGWTDVFASVGARTTGTGPGSYVIDGPTWTGPPLLPGALPLRSPTRLVRITGSTQVDGDGGYAGAHAIQDAYGLTPLLDGGAIRPAPSTVSRTPPVAQVEQMDAQAFFVELTARMQDNPPRLEDRAILERMRRHGLLLSDALDWRRLGARVRHAIAEGAARGLERVVATAESPPGDVMGGWRIRFRLGQYGTDYLGRAAAACAGLESGPAGDGLPALADTDASGQPLTGRRRYALVFPSDSLPPVHGFWTLTTYDARESLVDNPVEQYSIGDWNGLVLERDGAVVIRIQHTDPGAEAPNWLPAPPGPFNLLMHLCWPQRQVLDRGWAPPDVTPLAA